MSRSHYQSVHHQNEEAWEARDRTIEPQEQDTHDLLPEPSWDGESSPSCRSPDRLHSRRSTDEVSALSSHPDEEEEEEAITARRPSLGPSSSHNASPDEKQPIAIITQSGTWSETKPPEVVGRHKKPWTPFYLRRQVLLSSIVLCATLIVAIQVLAATSRKNQGLVTSSNWVHYAWTYGPTAVLTLIGASWSRVDYQAKLTAPWYRLAGSPVSARRTILLDYSDMMPPNVVVRGMIYGDYGVVASTSITLLWSLLIAFSASLLNLTPTEINENTVPITLLSTFSNSATALQNTGALSYYNMLGLQGDNNLTLQDGVSTTFAYQKFSSSSVSATAELHATVDGFSVGLDCDDASIHVDQALYIGTGIPYINATVTTSNCSMAVFFAGARFETSKELYLSRLSSGACHNSSKVDDQRVVVLFGTVEYDVDPSEVGEEGLETDQPINATLRSTQLLCRPTYTISRVDVVKNGTDVLNVSLSSPPNPTTLSNVQAWDIMEAHLNSVSNALTSPYVLSDGAVQSEQNFKASDVEVDVDLYMNVALGRLSKSPPSSKSLSDPSVLMDVANGYYQQYAALIANGFLMTPSSEASIGSAFVYQDRLVVSSTIGYVMTAILVVVIFLFAVIIFTSPSGSVLPRSPSTIIGAAALVAHSHTLLEYMSALGRANLGAIERRLANSNYTLSVQREESPGTGYVQILPTEDLSEREVEITPDSTNAKLVHPSSLSPWFIGGMAVFVIGMIASLEAVLQISLRNNGIADVRDDDRYISFSWTTGPSLILTVAGLIYTVMDSEYRTLTPYVNLNRGSSFGKSLGLNLMDVGIPRMLLTEMRSGSYAALAGSSAALIASLLATFSSSLFTSSHLLTTNPTQLHAVTSFNNGSVTRAGVVQGLTGSLLLESNLSYPAFTYQNLAFPTFQVDLLNPSNASLVINATVPALRPKMNCRLYDEASISTKLNKFTTTYVSKPSVTDIKLDVNITDDTCSTPDLVQWWQIQIGTALLENTLIAEAQYVGSCSDWGYFWANLAPGTDPSGTDPIVTFVNGVTCKETIEAVDVSMSFLGVDLHIDPSHPPMPVESTVRNTSAGASGVYNDIDKKLLYDQLPDLPNTTNTQLGEFFEALTTSRFAIPTAYLNGSAESTAVLDAIVFQHNILRVQDLADNLRAPANSTNAFTTMAGGNDELAYEATVIDSTGRTRVLQDPTSTRILEALLAATLLCSLTAWMLMPRTRVLPHGPTNIGAVTALLADGNVIDMLPEEAQHMSNADMEPVFRDNNFRMGWFLVETGCGRSEQPSEEQRFGIYATGRDG